MDTKDIFDRIARTFPTPDGIRDWAEHLEKKPELLNDFVRTEVNAPIVAWLLVQLDVSQRALIDVIGDATPLELLEVSGLSSERVLEVMALRMQ